MELAREFSDLEGSSVRKIVLDAIRSNEIDPVRERRVFNFNLFDVEIDYASGRVTIEEVCSPCRDEVVPLAAFVQVLQSAGI